MRTIKKCIVSLGLALVMLASLVLGMAWMINPQKDAAVVAMAETNNAQKQSLDNEEYARLLYLNNIEKANDYAHDFQKSGFDADEINYLSNSLDLYGGLNLGYLSLGYTASVLGGVDGLHVFSKASTVINIAKAINRMISVYQVNVNNAQMFNQLAGEMEDMYDSLSSELSQTKEQLSQELTAQTNYLAGKMDMDAYAAKIEAFNTTAFNGEGKGGYYGWKEDLLNKYNTLLTDKNTSGIDAKDIKIGYDYLYLAAKKGEILLSYMMSGQGFLGVNSSIQELVYWYYLLSWKEGSGNMNEAVEKCINFATDLYNTYLFSRICLTLCYEYQLQYLAEYGAPGTVYYELDESIETDDRSVSRTGEILPYAKDPEAKVQQLSLELCKYFVYILNLNESYQYKYDGIVRKTIYNEITTVPTHKSVSVDLGTGAIKDSYLSVNDSVQKGSTVYLNSIPKALTDALGLDFTFAVSDATKASVDKEGVLSVTGDSGDFTAYLMSGNTVLYCIPFTIEKITPFSGGGLGTAESPYVLTTETDFKTLAGNSSYWSKCFKLARNITLTGELSYIGNTTTAFTGTFDGNGYSVKGGKTRALFGVNNGTIKNLTIENASVTSGERGDPWFYSGGLVDVNNGTLSYCRVKNSEIIVTSNVGINAGDGSYYSSTSMFVGGLCGYNGGTIQSCESTGNKVKGYQTNPISDGAPEKNNGFVGGLCGSSTGGRVLDSLAANNEVYCYLKAHSYYIHMWVLFILTEYEYPCTAYFYVGGILGEADGATVQRCVGVNNSVSHTAEWHTSQNPNNSKTKEFKKDPVVNKKSSIGSANSSSSVSHVYVDTAVSSISDANKKVMTDNGWTWGTVPTVYETPTLVTVFKLPIKTFYTNGEALNIAGLTLKTNTEQYITDNIEVKNFSSSENGTIYVTAEWNGLETTFEVEVACSHENIKEQLSISEITCTTKTTSCQYYCEDCETALSTVEYEEQVSEDISRHTYDHNCDTTCNACGAVRTITHAWDDGRVSVEPTCTESGLEIFTCTVCTVTKEETLNAYGHSYTATVVAPTCTTGGYTTHICSRCSNSYVDTYVDANGHSWNNGTVVTPATCLTDGVKLVECLNCDEEKEDVITKLGHDYNSAVTSPTCTVGGYTTHDCSRCDSSYIDAYTDALGHNYIAAVTGATCTAGGYTTYTCSRGDDSYKSDYTNMLGHQYFSVVTDPTCTERGYTTHTCGRCPDTKVDTYTTALGHSWDAGVVTAPTCLVQGYTTHTCERCPETKVDTYTSALGHAYGVSSVTAPTCTTGGHTDYVCARCSGTKQDDYTNALGHGWTAGAPVAPTCTERGYTPYTCGRCPETKKDDYTSALGHNLLTVDAKAPTCTEKGSTEKVYCSDCDYVKTESTEVPATGHSHQATVTPPTCTEQGYTTYTCSCGDSYTADYINPAHKGGDWIVDKEAAVGEEGARHKECEICGESFDQESIPALTEEVNIVGCSGSVNGGVTAVALLTVLSAVYAFVRKKEE